MSTCLYKNMTIKPCNCYTLSSQNYKNFNISRASYSSWRPEKEKFVTLSSSSNKRNIFFDPPKTKSYETDYNGREDIDITPRKSKSKPYEMNYSKFLTPRYHKEVAEKELHVSAYASKSKPNFTRSLISSDSTSSAEKLRHDRTRVTAKLASKEPNERKPTNHMKTNTGQSAAPTVILPQSDGDNGNKFDFKSFWCCCECISIEAAAFIMIFAAFIMNIYYGFGFFFYGATTILGIFEFFWIILNFVIVGAALLGIKNSSISYLVPYFFYTVIQTCGYFILVMLIFVAAAFPTTEFGEGNLVMLKFFFNKKHLSVEEFHGNIWKMISCYIFILCFCISSFVVTGKLYAKIEEKKQSSRKKFLPVLV